MKPIVKCKRGNIGPRDKWGHCLCADCYAFNRARWSVSTAEKTEYKRRWRKENPERCRGYSKKWNDNNQDQRRKIVRAWQEKNPEKVRAKNARAGAKWSKKNVGKRNAITRKRAALKLQRTPIWADLKAIKAFYIEAARLTAETGIPHEVDHIYPLQGRLVSGLHVEGNLQILMRSQNRSKGNKARLTWDSAS